MFRAIKEVVVTVAKAVGLFITIASYPLLCMAHEAIQGLQDGCQAA